MHDDYDKEMTKEDYEFVLEWQTKNRIRDVRLIGGEPTLHSQFDEFVKMALRRGMFVHVFTNGTNLTETFTLPGVSALINLNSPRKIGKKRFDDIVANLLKLRENRLWYGGEFGINMWEMEDDYVWFLDTLEKVEQSTFRFSLSLPEYTDDSLEFFKERWPCVLEFIGKCMDRKIIPRGDCNRVPHCIMSEEVRASLLEFCPGLIHISACSPVLDVFPDLTVGRCFGFGSDFGISLKDFKTYNEYDRYFIKNIDMYGFLLKANEKCEKCSQFKAGICDGGCMALKRNRIRKLRGQVEEIIQ
jgi:hypothetical protein